MFIFLHREKISPERHVIVEGIMNWNISLDILTRAVNYLCQFPCEYESIHLDCNGNAEHFLHCRIFPIELWMGKLGSTISELAEMSDFFIHSERNLVPKTDCSQYQLLTK